MERCVSSRSRHLLAIAACAVVLWLLWFLLDNLDAYRKPLPTFVRSMLPVFLRRHIRLSELDATFADCFSPRAGSSCRDCSCPSLR